MVARVEDGLAAFAIISSKSRRHAEGARSGEEFVMPDEFVESVVPLKDIQSWTGIEFDAALHAVDQYYTARGPDAAQRDGADGGA